MDAAMDWERFRDELAEIRRRIGASEGRRVGLDTEALIRTFSIVHRNAKELVDWVREGQEGPNALLLQSKGNEADLDDYFHELTRKLHNFVASVGTLVDHARRLVRRLLPNGPVRTSYDERVAAIDDSMEHQVLQALRNYTLHYALPGLTSQVRMRPNDEQAPVQVQFGIDVQSLVRSGFDLSAKQRKAMEGMAIIWLGRIVPSYMHRVEALYTWLLAETRSTYTKEIAETNHLIEEHNRMIREAGLVDEPGTGNSASP